VQNGRQIDLSTQVERVKRKTRPWKSIIALLLAIASAILSRQARNDSGLFSGTNQTTAHLVSAGLAVAFLVFGSIATYSLAGNVRQLIQPRVGAAHAAVVGYAILIVGAFTTLVITLELFTVPVGQLVLGGALTSVFVGIAAQQALGNVFAGLVLLVARPFKVGDAIRLQAGALGGELDGIVTDIGITYVRFDTDGSVMSIPNSQVLNAVVGPIPPEPENPEPEDPEAAADGKSGTPGGPEQPQPRPAGPA
jgi:small-conductance mechanosensitive channel